MSNRYCFHLNNIKIIAVCLLIFFNGMAYSRPERLINGGTGLELPVTKPLIELHGGHIFLESFMGQESAFNFDLDVHENRGSKKIVKANHFSLLCSPMGSWIC